MLPLLQERVQLQLEVGAVGGGVPDVGGGGVGNTVVGVTHAGGGEGNGARGAAGDGTSSLLSFSAPVSALAAGIKRLPISAGMRNRDSIRHNKK